MGNNNQYNGIVNIYKPAGFTSFDVVAKLRGIYGQKKIGHTGTLDPDAVGVLPVCLGNATKVCELLTDHDKVYEAELLLGEATDTQDASGKRIGGNPEAAMKLSKEVIEDTIKGFVGEYMQVPPMYSALKVNGKKLYDLARAGIEVERQARAVYIFDIEILETKQPVIRMRVHCSKGTYIRTLCDDIGKKLGCGGLMKSLKRTKVGPFECSNAYTLEKIQEFKEKDLLADTLMSVDSLFEDLPAIEVRPDYLKLILNGNKLGEDMVILKATDSDVNSEMQKRYRVYLPDGSFAGIFEWNSATKEYKPVKMFL